MYLERGRVNVNSMSGFIKEGAVRACAFLHALQRKVVWVAAAITVAESAASLAFMKENRNPRAPARREQ